MEQTAAQRAHSASTIALGVCILAVVALLMSVVPSVDITASKIVLIVLFGSAAAVGQFVHWVFLGIAAHRLNRSVAGWVALSVLLFPIGSVVALLMLWWYGAEQDWQPAPGAGQRAAGAAHEASGN